MRIQFLFPVLVALYGCAPAGFGAAQIVPNTWTRIHPKVIPTSDGGRPTPQGWNILVYDSNAKRILTIDRWGSKERGNSIYANAVMSLDLTANTLSCLKISNWKVVPTSTGGYQTVAMPENGKEPTPLDRHPYACVAFVPEQNAIYLASGANQTGPGGHPDDTWKFDLKTNAWSLVTQTAPAKELLTDAMIYDSANKLIVRPCLGRATWFLDPRATEWKKANCKSESRCGAGASLAYDSKRGRIFLYGGPGSEGKVCDAPGVELWTYTVKENKWTRLPDGPIAARYAGLAYAPTHDAIFLHGRAPDEGQNWPLDPGYTAVYLPVKNQWYRFPDPGSVGPKACAQTLAYDEAHDVFVRMDTNLTTRELEWWVFRLDPKRLPPAAPATEARTAGGR